jgi:N-acetylmuramoyl-L-alanine amidase
VSLQNDDLSYGVAILYENGLREFQGWQKRDLPFNNVRSRIVFGLPGRGVVQARAYLLVGSFAQIQSEAEDLLRTMPAFGVLDEPAGDVSSGPTTLRGWALDNRGVASLEARIDETVTVPLTYGGARPDVCLVWPGYPDCGGVGYSGTYDFGPASSCPHLVEIIATDTDGNRRTIAERLVRVR